MFIENSSHMYCTNSTDLICDKMNIILVESVEVGIRGGDPLAAHVIIRC